MRSNPRLYLTILLVLAAAALLLPPPAAWATPAQLPVERTIRLEAGRYSFVPGTIRVNPGDRVTIELVATDVVHGLYLDGYGLELAADPGQTARLTFTASRRGTFRIRCSIPCGAMHPFMIGKLQVGSNQRLAQGMGLALLALAGGLLLATRGPEAAES